MKLFDRKSGIEGLLNQIKDRERITPEEAAIFNEELVDSNRRDRRFLMLTYFALVAIGGAITIGGTYLAFNKNMDTKVEKDKSYCTYLQMVVPQDFKEISAPYTNLPCSDVFKK